MHVESWSRRGTADRKVPSYPNPASGCLRLDANTNVLGTNPAVARALARAGTLEINHYPSALSDDLCRALAADHGLLPDNVVVGNGSDGVIDLVTKAFLDPRDPVATPAPTFVMYRHYVEVNLGRLVEIPLVGPDFELDVEGILEVGAKLTILASPNNPTGNAFAASDLERIIRESSRIVVIDEAYSDFAEQDFSGRVAEFENLLVLRTFSKAHGLAGIRVGYALGPEALIRQVKRVKAPFEVSTLSEAIALEALRDKTFWKTSVATVREERRRLSEELSSLGFRPVPSQANFLLVDVGYGPAARAFLVDRGLLTRDWSSSPRLISYLRVTVGRREDNDRLVSGLKAWKSEIGA